MCFYIIVTKSVLFYYSICIVFKLFIRGDFEVLLVIFKSYLLLALCFLSLHKACWVRSIVCLRPNTYICVQGKMVVSRHI